MADGIVSNSPQGGGGYTYTTTWAAIKNAAKTCNWCKLLPQRNAVGQAEVIVRYYKDTGYTPIGDKFLTVMVRDLKDGSMVMTEDLLLYTVRGNEAANVIQARDRITQLWTEESFAMAKACISNCARKHGATCPPLQNASILPDRVIDCVDTSNPKIILTDGKIYASYVTLSYVWGGPQPMLTTENIDKYTTTGLKMTDFPQSIRDAVTVTNKIGQRYLWLDALCIIQDSPEDKTIQLGKMHAIYKNSYLTINATNSNNTYEGFLHQPRPQREPRTEIPFPCPNEKIGSVFIAYESISSNSEWPSQSYWDELEPINSRGWCYQEKVLPARSLLYASDTLKYYCQTETVSIGDALCEQSTGMRLPSGTYSISTTCASESDEVQAELQRRQSWLAALFQYSMRDLTVSSDRLPAFAAVAEQFSLLNQDQYLAGLWRKSLLLDLLWVVEDKCSRPDVYRAPSWTWASVDGLVSGEFRFDALAKPDNREDVGNVRVATVIDCHVTLASELTPFGEVTDGILTLGGLLLEVHYEDAVVEKRLIFNSDGGSRDVGSILISPDAKENWSDEIYAIPLLWNAHGVFMFGLIVSRVRDSGGTLQYRRLGRFQRKEPSIDLTWIDALPRQKILIV